MKKGLTLTLLTLVVGFVAAQANAMAPVIDDMPDYVVGNAAVTGATGFVYQDAIAVNAFVDDPDGDDDSILWAFDSAGRYIFNGVQALGAGDPLAPGAKDFAAEANLNDIDLDSDARTVTIRDQIYSPLTGTGSAPGSGYSASEVVTLYASDGSTYAQTEIMVYSLTDGPDGTSPIAPPTDTRTFNTGQAGGFTSGDQAGSTTFATNADGLCMTVAAAGFNFGTFTGGYGNAAGGEDLVANKVYRIKLAVSSSQTTELAVPLADFIVENLGTGVGDFAYAMDTWFHDNVGSANAAMGPAVGRTYFEVWFAPPAVGTAQWNDGSTGAFTAGHDANNDMRFRWRTLDSDLPYGGANDSGSICLKSISIQRFDLGALVAGTQVFNVTNFGTADVRTFDVVTGSGFVESNFTVGGGGELTITPKVASGWDIQICSINPGDGTFDVINDTGIPDDFPITWADETLYQITTSISADGSAGGPGETDGHDAIRLSMDNPGFEVISENYQTTGLDKAGMPKAGAGQTFMSFHHGMSESLSSVANHHRLRPRLDALSTTGYDRPAGNTANAGGMVFHNWSVRTVTFPGMTP